MPFNIRSMAHWDFYHYDGYLYNCNKTDDKTGAKYLLCNEREKKNVPVNVPSRMGIMISQANISFTIEYQLIKLKQKKPFGDHYTKDMEIDLNNKQYRNILQEVMLLALLPAEDIENKYTKIKNNTAASDENLSILNFITDVKTQWIGNETSQKLTLFNNINGINDVHVIHLRVLQIKLKSDHPTFWNFLNINEEKINATEFIAKCKLVMREFFDDFFVDKRKIVAIDQTVVHKDIGNDMIDTTCQICTVQNISACWKPCHHAITCMSCVKRIPRVYGCLKCPYCNSRCTDFFQIHL
ncbi:hypothetical protein KQX54_011125 [Cotesia glomerata]|uniref:RING-type domain-containing protein n=1 Tax=Cotesia glomerata TaxID=32391 RepID=A0AAV7IHI6_COTGL|nr:hypothetical protein KQX54_011125 [Cotesia glomerata]